MVLPFRAIRAFVATHYQLHVLFVGEAAPQECLGCFGALYDLPTSIYHVLFRNLDLASQSFHVHVLSFWVNLTGILRGPLTQKLASFTCMK